MQESSMHNHTHAKRLVLDELFDLTLYKKMREYSKGELALMLDKLIRVEHGHLSFWREFFSLNLTELDLKRKLKLWFLTIIFRIFGERGMFLILEAIEVYGVRKYLNLWEMYKDEPLGKAVKNILKDEFEHEDTLVSAAIERNIKADRIRNTLLGFNDGLVEILGAVSGFFAAFGTVTAVLTAASTVAVAGAFSMAAGAFVAASSEKEVTKTEREKDLFLGKLEEKVIPDNPFRAAAIVGISYIVGAAVPILPVLAGSSNIILSLIVSAFFIIIVSFVLAFLTGMDTKKRIIINLAIVMLAVGVTYGIGILVKNYFGISI